MTLPACKKKHVVFIIHWKLSHYTSYFLSLLKSINQTNRVTLVDCSVDGYENSFKDHKSFYDHYLTFEYGSEVEDLVTKIQEHGHEEIVVISNSIRNELEPGSRICERLNGTHILFEHLSSLVNANQKISDKTLENLGRVNTVFIPSIAIKPFFQKYKEDSCIHVQALNPAPHFFSDIKKEKLIPNQMIYVGRVIPEKKILNFLEVNKFFFETNKINFVIVGSGEQEKMLQDYCDRNKWIKRLPQGTPIEVQKMIDESIAVVIPSPQESYSMLAVEGLLRGTPVIMQNTGIGIGLHGKIPGLFKLSEDLILTKQTLDEVRKFDTPKKTASMMRGYLRADKKTLIDLIKYG